MACSGTAKSWSLPTAFLTNWHTDRFPRRTILTIFAAYPPAYGPIILSPYRIASIAVAARPDRKAALSNAPRHTVRKAILTAQPILTLIPATARATAAPAEQNGIVLRENADAPHLRSSTYRPSKWPVQRHSERAFWIGRRLFFNIKIEEVVSILYIVGRNPDIPEPQPALAL